MQIKVHCSCTNQINNISFRLVLIGFFLLPFENLIIAPSAGWPAISPVFFLFALIFMGKENVINKAALKWFIGLTILSCVGWTSTILMDGGNRYFYRDVLGSFLPLIMGYAFYQSSHHAIFYKDTVNHDYLKRLLNSLILGSKVAMFFSIIILLFAHIFRTGMFVELLTYVLKRNQESLRFSFLFAEPSFISVHILGVLFPFAWLSWRFYLYEQMTSLVIIIITYVAISLVFLESARFLLDVAFLVVIVSFFYLGKSMVILTADKLMLLCGAFGVLIYSTLINPTVIEILTLGRVSLDGSVTDIMNSDASLASRFFRTDAVYQAFIYNPVLLLSGVGYGNIGYLVDLGYQAAIQNFTSFFTKEVDAIYFEGSGANVFNMYARVIGEFGLLTFILIVTNLYDKKVALLFFVIFWCYLQFDSYAFYGVWIYLIAKSMVKSEEV